MMNAECEMRNGGTAGEFPFPFFIHHFAFIIPHFRGEDPWQRCE